MSESQHLHADELIELYALGSLAPDEAASVESHVAACEPCRNRLRDAEEGVTAMIEAGEMHDAPAALKSRIAAPVRARRPQFVQSWGALAAAFLLGVIPSVWFYEQNMRAQTAAGVQSAAIASLVHSHFSHAPFEPIVSSAPQAKVIFPRDGSWFYVVVAAPADGLQIGTVAAGRTRILGVPTGTGQSSAYYANATQGLHNVVLIQNGRIVARAPIASH